MDGTNHRITLARRPVGPVGPECFATDDVAIPSPGPGEVLVAVRWLSIDPTIRGWMAMDTYLPAIAIGDPVRSVGIGEVIESNVDTIPVGATVFGLTGWQQYAVLDASATVLPDGIDPTAALSVFGVTGLTAYFGLLDLGRPAPGETVVVSGAAGATGSVVGQIARIKGCRAIGIAGTAEKCAWLVDELGFDAAIDYRTEDVSARLGELCPDGLDVFFDNVGGDILEAALDHLAMHARVVLCGAISAYNDETPRPGPRNLMNLVIQRSRMEGFIVMDYMGRTDEAMADLVTWVLDGSVQFAVDVVDGLDQAPAALDRLFTGANRGKVMVRL
jgi:hypothetical protein